MRGISDSTDKDDIRWVETRLRERAAFDEGLFPFWRQLQSTQPQKNLKIWLAKKRDGLSWQQIAIKYLPEHLQPGGLGKSAAISKLRRICDAVQREVAPTNKEMVQSFLDGKIEELFGVTPEMFKKYLFSINSDRRVRKRSKKQPGKSQTNRRSTK